MAKIIAETKRCILREFQLGDAEAMYRLNNDPAVLKHTGDLPFDSVEAAENFILNYKAYSETGFGRWAVIDKKSNEFLGWCGLKQHVTFVDLGFRFHQEHWGKGFATETSIAVFRIRKNQFAII